MRRDSRPPMDVPSGPIVDEDELIRRCRLGDRVAFEQLYRAHRRQVAGNLFRVLGDRSELDDLVQEVFVIAFRGLDRFRGDAKLSTWIYRICVNVALGKLRARARKPPPVQAEATLEEAAVEATPETLLTKREDVARLYKILDALTPKKRVVLVLHEIQGLDIKQIAEIVGAPLVTVRTRLHYARKEFYRLIAEAKE